MWVFRVLLLIAGASSALGAVIECAEGCAKVFNAVFVDTDFEEAKRLISEIDTPCKHFYSYFLHHYYEIDPKKMTESLLVACESTCGVQDLAGLILATKIEEKMGLLGSVEESGEWYKKVAEKVHSRFFDKKLTLFAKWEFENLRKEGENTRIIDFIKTLTKSGDSLAVDNLLSLIKIGHVDASLHLDFLKECARSEHSDALGILGNMYYYGWGVKKNRITARHYFAEGAKRNDPDSLNGLGMILISENSTKDGKKALEKASSLGSAAADYNLFLLHEHKNAFLAEVYLVRAGKKEGYLPAVYKHGEMAWTRKEYANASLQFKSITAYHPTVLEIEKLSLDQCKQGRNTEAFYTSLLLGDMGSITGYKNALFILNHRQTRVPNRDALSILINRRLADRGFDKSTITLGDIYYHGRGVPKDDRKAFARYFAASLQGSTEGHYMLGWMYEHGCGTHKDLRAAKYLYDRMYAKNPATYLLYGVLAAKIFLKMHSAAIVSLLVAGVIGAAGMCAVLFARTHRPARAQKKKAPVPEMPLPESAEREGSA